jgi:hypothetical protein
VRLAGATSVAAAALLVLLVRSAGLSFSLVFAVDLGAIPPVSNPTPTSIYGVCSVRAAATHCSRDSPSTAAAPCSAYR